MNPIHERRLLKWGLFLACLLTIAGLWAFYSKTQAEGWLQISTKLQLLLWSGAAWAAVVLVITLAAWLGDIERLISWLKQIAGRLSRLGWLLLPLSLILAVVFPVLMFTEPSVYLSQGWTRQAVFLWLWAAVTFSLAALWRRPWPQSAALAGLGMAVIYHLATYIPHISNYPFGLWWSETTRYYLASTYLGQQIYSQELPWAMKDMTRYLIQALPFLIPGAPIWVHRLWQVLLRFFTGYLTGYLLARRLKISSPLSIGLFTAWAGLFFFQGPVFYHLIVVVILVLWLADIDRFWKTLVVILAASFYAGFSRINWVPMAGLIAAVIYFMETLVEGRAFKQVVRYLAPPAIWVVAGMATGLAVQQYWAVNSGNAPEIYLSSFTSYMLWDRLLPNPSFPLGILPLIMLVSAPLLVYLAIGPRFWRQIHWIRTLGLLGILSGLFAGGLIVSVKIGGGTNLHNMDVFLVVLLIIAVELYYQRGVDQNGQPVKIAVPPWLMTAVIAAPVIYTISFGGLGKAPVDPQAASNALEELQAYVDEAVSTGGDVLFMSERHLITFGLIEDVPLVHDYEKMLLQEMVMGNNQAYLQTFAEDMASQQYALIITDKMPVKAKDPATESLAMENNVVYETIVPMMSCAYQVETRIQPGNLELWVPKPKNTCQVP